MYHHDLKEVNNQIICPCLHKNCWKKHSQKIPAKRIFVSRQIGTSFQTSKGCNSFFSTNCWSPLRIVVNGGNSPSPTRHHRGQPGGHRGTTTTGPLPPPLLPSSRGGSVVLSVDTRNPKSPLASGRSKHCRVNGLGFGKISVFVGPKKSMRKPETLIFTDVLKRFGTTEVVVFVGHLLWTALEESASACKSQVRASQASWTNSMDKELP